MEDIKNQRLKVAQKFEGLTLYKRASSFAQLLSFWENFLTPVQLSLSLKPYTYHSHIVLIITIRKPKN